MNERRLENRFLCADLVRVDWSRGENLKGDGEFATAEAVLEDISALGACVQVEDRIPTGAFILMSANFGAGSGSDASFSGQVSYCEYRDCGYFVGIQFSDETRWSSRVFEPQHLTNLAVLAKAGKSDENTRESGSKAKKSGKNPREPRL